MQSRPKPGDKNSPKARPRGVDHRQTVKANLRGAPPRYIIAAYCLDALAVAEEYPLTALLCKVCRIQDDTTLNSAWGTGTAQFPWIL